MTNFILLVISFVGLIIGGEWLVRGAVSFATHFSISPLLIGLTLVGFGTSMPELATAVQAAFANSPGIAVGSVIGSNITNLLLILGITALIHPLQVDSRSLKRDGTILLFASILTVPVVLKGHMTATVGFVFVAALLIYVIGTYFLERRASGLTIHQGRNSDSPTPLINTSTISSLTIIILGFSVMLASSHFLVRSAVSISEAIGISETIIGLTVVAIGTSLPELVACVIASRRGKNYRDSHCKKRLITDFRCLLYSFSEYQFRVVPVIDHFRSVIGVKFSNIGLLRTQ